VVPSGAVQLDPGISGFGSGGSNAFVDRNGTAAEGIVPDRQPHRGRKATVSARWPPWLAWNAACACWSPKSAP